MVSSYEPGADDNSTPPLDPITALHTARGLVYLALQNESEAIQCVLKVPDDAWPDTSMQCAARAIRNLVDSGHGVDAPGIMLEAAKLPDAPENITEQIVQLAGSPIRCLFPDRAAQALRADYARHQWEEARREIQHQIGLARTPGEVAALLESFNQENDADSFTDDLADWRELAGLEVPMLTSGIPLSATTVIAGAGGLGKSTLARCVALSVMTGRSLLDAFPVHEPGRVVFLSGEDPAQIFLRSLMNMSHFYGIGEEKLDRAIRENLTLRAGRPFPWLSPKGPTSDFMEFRRLCRRVKPALIVVDTVRKHYGGESENDATQAGAWMQLAQHVAHDTRAAMVCLHHVSKSGEGAQVVRGSTAFRDEARSVFTLSRTATGFNLRHDKANWTLKVADAEFDLSSGVCQQVAAQSRDLKAVGDAIADWLHGQDDAFLTLGGIRQRNGRDAKDLCHKVAVRFNWADKDAVADAAQMALKDGRLTLVPKRRSNGVTKEVLAIPAGHHHHPPLPKGSGGGDRDGWPEELEHDGREDDSDLLF